MYYICTVRKKFIHNNWKHYSGMASCKGNHYYVHYNDEDDLSLRFVEVLIRKTSKWGFDCSKEKLGVTKLDQLNENERNTYVAIVVISPNQTSLTKRTGQMVLNRSIVNNKRIIPICLQGAESDDFKDLISLKFKTEQDWNNSQPWERLKTNLEEICCPDTMNSAAFEKTYSTGKVYNREDIHALLKKKNRVVMKYGCSTGWTSGTFRLDGAVFRAPHPVHDGDIQFNVCLHDQFEIQSDTENIFATKSDSGALVYMEDNDELVAIGMVVAGMADVCFVTPLDEILEALGLDPKNGLKHFNSEVKKNASEDSGDSSYTRNTSLINDKETKLRSDLTQVSSDVESMKGDMNVLKQDVNDIRTDMGDMKRGMRDGFDAILKRLALGREPTDQ